MKGRKTAVLGVRVPDELYKKVQLLASKRGVTMNEWLKNVVAAAAKYGDEVEQHVQQ